MDVIAAREWHGGDPAGPLRFEEEPPRGSGGSGGRRVLSLERRALFELAYWCGTEPIMFEPEEDAPGRAGALPHPDLRAELDAGLTSLDAPAVATYGARLPEDDYVVMLLEVRPRLVIPDDRDDYAGKADDYATTEQIASWGGTKQTGASRSPYFRTFETAVSPTAHLLEFVVPMVPPSWNDRDTVARHRAAISGGARPTAVALSTLDVVEAAMSDDLATDHYEQRGLVHFLLDGHHKVAAAANLELPITLLAFVSIGNSLARPEQVRALPLHRSRPAASRP